MDPLSAAASAISVASIGIQITESIHSLIRFCKSMKDAPDVIESISEDLAVLDEILTSLLTYHQCIQLQRPDSSTESPQPVPKALTICLKRLRGLEQMVSGLEKGMSSRKAWTSLKAALKDDTIKNFQTSLESAKASLVLANQLFHNQLLQSQLNSSLAQQERPLSSAEVSVDQLVVVPKRTSFQRTSKSPEMTSPAQARKALSVDDTQDGHPDPYRPDAAELSMKKPAKSSLVLRRQFSIHPQRGLRDKQIIPSDSDVLRYATRGNVEQIWSLFDQGLASPFDADRHGFTPLHQAARHFHPMTCKLLVDLGADCNALTRSDFTPLSLVSTDMLLRPNQSIKHIVDLTRILLENGDADPDIETERGLPIYYSYEGNTDGIKLLINHSNVGPNNIGNQTVGGWGVLHEQICYGRYHDQFLLERLRYWLSHGADVNGRIEEEEQNGFPPGTTPLHVACQGTWDFSGRRRYLLLLKPGFLQLFLDASVNLHAVDGLGYTVLRYIFVDFPDEELVWWFNLLDFLSIDVENYLDTERAIHENSSFDPIEAWRKSYVSPACSYRRPQLDQLAESFERMELLDTSGGRMDMAHS